MCRIASLFLLQRLKGSMSGDARDFNNMETRDVIKFIFLQGKAPKEIHTILTETLACFLPGRAKDLSAPLYVTLTVLCPTSFVRSIYHITLKNIFAILVCFCLRLFECNSSRNKRGIFMKLWTLYGFLVKVGYQLLLWHTKTSVRGWRASRAKHSWTKTRREWWDTFNIHYTFPPEFCFLGNN